MTVEKSRNICAMTVCVIFKCFYFIVTIGIHMDDVDGYNIYTRLETKSNKYTLKIR